MIWFLLICAIILFADKLLGVFVLLAMFLARVALVMAGSAAVLVSVFFLFNYIGVIS